jgi:hypothetical protein
VKYLKKKNNSPSGKDKFGAGGDYMQAGYNSLGRNLSKTGYPGDENENNKK